MFKASIIFNFSSRVHCSGFIIGNNNELEPGTAFSAPTRLEYKQPNFQMVNFKQPMDGALYTSTLQQLFPQSVYDLATRHDSTGESRNLGEEVKSKTRKQKLAWPSRYLSGIFSISLWRVNLQ